jgi:hypothetical protein
VSTPVPPVARTPTTTWEKASSSTPRGKRDCHVDTSFCDVVDHTPDWVFQSGTDAQQRAHRDSKVVDGTRNVELQQPCDVCGGTMIVPQSGVPIRASCATCTTVRTIWMRAASEWRRIPDVNDAAWVTHGCIIADSTRDDRVLYCFGTRPVWYIQLDIALVLRYWCTHNTARCSERMVDWAMLCLIRILRRRDHMSDVIHDIHNHRLRFHKAPVTVTDGTVPHIARCSQRLCKMHTSLTGHWCGCGALYHQGGVGK